MLSIYKRNQGKYTRTVSFVAVMVLALFGAAALSDKLSAYSATRAPYIQYGVPTLVFLTLGVLTFWLVNRPKSADFLIQTEGEMKKVSWSSRKEVIGSTKVVIVTTFVMAVLLFSVDLLFKELFNMLGILKI